MINEKLVSFLVEFICVTIFINIFFFYVGIKVEHDSTNIQLGSVVDEFVSVFKNPPLKLDDIIEIKSQADIVKKIIDNNYPRFNIKEYNDKLEKKLAASFILIIILIFSIWYVYKDVFHISLSLLLLENIMIFVFIGAFEYYFFTRFVIKYIPILPSEIQVQIQEHIKNKLNFN